MTELRIEVDASGVDLEALADEFAYELFQAVDAGAAYVEEEAKATVPVDEGRLQGSITHETSVDEDGVISAKLGSGLDYAVYVEYGTGPIGGNSPKAEPSFEYSEVPWTYYSPKLKRFVRTAGRPADGFLRDALNTMEPQIVYDVKRTIGKVCDDRHNRADVLPC